MNFQDFRRVLTSFADNPSDVDWSKGRVVVQIRDEVIEIEVQTRSGTLVVLEDGEEQTAEGWLIRRVARLHQLADRILSYVESERNFVTPSGAVLDQIEVASDEISHTNDAVSAIREILDRRPGGTTSILYLTSDAGEGKTTLIHQLATDQAAAYKRRETDWLLLPVTLGGRAFSRFDDVVIAALVNRLRFQLFYYEAFLELVKLGVLVPAFDGFEEMFVESGSGEAMSALGNLVRMLDSAGTVLISARKAYFDYKSFAARARLVDAIRRDSVSFARLSLERWNEEQFLEYCEKRGLPHPRELYQKVTQRLSDEHPLVTRAVLVKRLVDIAETQELEDLLAQLGNTPQDYFYQFVNTIVIREANEKWIDRSGTPYRPLLTVDEHHELLSMVAQEMWLSGSEILRSDVLDVVAEVFSEGKGKSPLMTRQIHERLPQHSLLTSIDSRQSQFAFDHEDFRKYFLGEAIGRALVQRSESDLRSILQVGTFPPETSDAAVQFVRREGPVQPELVTLLNTISGSDSPTSFTRENCGAVGIRLVDGLSRPVRIEKMVFATDALRARHLDSIIFSDCYFAATSLESSSLIGCTFSNVTFERLELADTTRVINTQIENAQVGSVQGADTRRHFDPAGKQIQLRNSGFEYELSSEQLELGAGAELSESVPDEEFTLTERALRLFWRATHLNEITFRQRLGVRANHFVDTVLPELLKVGILEELQYSGGGRQRRFGLGLPLEQIDGAMLEARGKFNLLLEALEGARAAKAT